MSSAAISFLIIGCVVLLLVFATIYKKHSRIILWSGAITSFLALCFLFASGIFKPVENDTKHNAAILGTSILMLATSGLLITTAEHPEKLPRLNRKRKKAASIPVLAPVSIEEESEGKNETVKKGTDVLITEDGSLKGVIIPRGLNTPLARRVFTKALEVGYISVNGTRLIWNDSTVLLAYMCGRIYCKDKAEKVPHENKYYWEKGQDGLPNAELTRLFQREGIGQARLNRKSATAPKKFEEIDKIFERS